MRADNEKTDKKIVPVVLSIGLMVSGLTGDMIKVHATQPPIGSGAIVETSETSPVGAGETQDIYLTVDKKKVSFGTVSEGYGSDAFSSYAITLTNTGNDDMEITWYCNDPDQSFLVDAPAELVVPAGGNLMFYTIPTPGLSAGQYQSVLLFASVDDPGYVNAAQVTETVIVREAVPYVNAVKVNPGNAQVNAGGEISFSANVTGGNNPDLSVDWQVSGQKSGNTGISQDGVLTVGVDEQSANLQVTAVSREDSSVSGIAQVSVDKKDFTVSATSSPSEGGAVSGAGTYHQGDSVTLRASAQSSFVFQGWYSGNDCISTNSICQINDIEQNMAYVAHFAKNTVNVSLSANHDAGGTVTGGGVIAYDGSMTIQASANAGYYFNGWYENNNQIGSNAKMELDHVTSDRKIVARFSKSEYKISLSVNDINGGNVTGGGTFKEGNDVLLKAEPASGYQFQYWVENGQIVSNDKEFTIRNVRADHCYVANFTKNQTKLYTIKAQVIGIGGNITPQGDVNYQTGNNALYTFVPKSGYRIMSVKVDNTEIGAVTNYTFQNIQGNHSIAVSFAKVENTAARPDPVQITHNYTTPGGTTQSKGGTTQPKGETSQGTEVLQEDPIENESYPVEAEDDIFHLNSYGGILQELNMTAEEAAGPLTENNEEGRQMLELAVEQDYLQLVLNNAYCEKTQEIVTSLSADDITAQNIEEVISSVMSTDEKLYIMNGDRVSLNLSIADYSDFISEEQKEAMTKVMTPEEKIGSYFDIFFSKAMDGDSEMIHELGCNMKVTMQIPETLQKANRGYGIVRVHENEESGEREVAVLEDLDENPDTITFETDRFSAYAIIYKDGSQSIWEFVLIAGIALVVLVIIGTLITFVLPHKRKR
ncbi:MAG: InlB B-repeat-containing protein [Lachnospiraceae bacterium]|nr:InlB B-repeat-containing protein [Lachnospiraceae bacterium]